LKSFNPLLVLGDDFVAEDGLLRLNYGSKPSLLQIINRLKDNGLNGPYLLRFPHLIHKQIKLLYNSFYSSIKEYRYSGEFHAVFPLKVNQFAGFIKPLQDIAKEFNYGLEAGSKAELVLAMSQVEVGMPITVNGFKDEQMIRLGFIATASGHNITLIIEGVNELESIIKISKEYANIVPNIGIRIRLHSVGEGIWAKSGGIHSKFGLTSTEILDSLKLLKNNNLLDSLKMLHFHIGSQINKISPLKKAIREAGNIYAELIKMGANNLQNINIGGGLSVEYEDGVREYTLSEFSNDVVFGFADIAKAKDVKEPNIFTESGRFVSASHSVLIASVLELFTHEYELSSLSLKEVNPPLLDELNELYNSIDYSNAREFLHDSIDHLESLLTLFDLGYIDLVDRSNAEILTNLIIKKAIELLHDQKLDELLKITANINEKYLVNFSIFQSLADFWGLGQKFPISPIHHLDKKPTRLASIWDITCDSDGEIEFDKNNPLILHDIDIKTHKYYLGFFLTGAYQETLGMNHNLFAKPNDVIVDVDSSGYSFVKVQKADSILEVLSDLDYHEEEIKSKILQDLVSSKQLKDAQKQKLKTELIQYMNESSYLR
jgi:arginine decarboxylase